MHGLSWEGIAAISCRRDFRRSRNWQQCRTAETGKNPTQEDLAEAQEILARIASRKVNAGSSNGDKTDDASAPPGAE